MEEIWHGFFLQSNLYNEALKEAITQKAILNSGVTIWRELIYKQKNKLKNKYGYLNIIWLHFLDEENDAQCKYYYNYCVLNKR
jgi:hypothetical protein